MLGAAVRSLRRPHRVAQFDRREMRDRRAGMELIATWSETSTHADVGARSVESHAVAALAAGVALPTLETEAAAKLAQAEGLVTHLTSLILVDEAGAVQEGIPATRKVALPSPAGAVLAPLPGAICPASAPVGAPLWSDATSRAEAEAGRQRHEKARQQNAQMREDASVSRGRLLRRVSSMFRTRVAASDLAALAARIDWDTAPQRLQAGDLAALDGALAETIRRIASELFVAQEARVAGCEPVVFVIGLLAQAAARRSRTADRIARAILGERPTGEIFGEIDRLVHAW
jgi:hypothetical protein